MASAADVIPLLAVALEARARVRMRVRHRGRAAPEWITGRVRIFEPPDHPFGVILEHRNGDGANVQTTYLLDAIESMEILDG